MAAANSSAKRICPDCGAEMASNANVCWLCAYKSPPVTAEVVGSGYSGGQSSWRRGGQVAAIVICALLLGPACFVTFFVTCLTVASAQNRFDNALLWGALSALIPFALLLALIIHFSRRLMSPS